MSQNSKKKTQQNREPQEILATRIYFIVLFVWGICFSFLIPTWQTPDEFSHLQVMGEAVGCPDLAATLMEDLPLSQGEIRGNVGQKVEMELYKVALTKKPAYTVAECLPKQIRSYVLTHLPAMIGIYLGIFLHFPTYWVLTLGELFAFFFAFAICYVAIRILPDKKEVMMLLIAFPMTMQQMTTISYDSVLLPLCFLFVAYMIYLRKAVRQIRGRELLLALVLLALIAKIKIPYVFLGGLVFILPLDKIKITIGKKEIREADIKKLFLPTVILGTFFVIAVGIIFRENVWLRIIYGMVAEWKRSIYILLQTMHVFGGYLLTSSVGQFGWLEVAVPTLFVIFSYGLLFLFAFVKDFVPLNSPAKPYGMKVKQRICLLVTFAVLFLFIILSMVNHTITMTMYGEENIDGAYNVREALYLISFVGGLQGRYFIPFLGLPFLALPEKIEKRDWMTFIVSFYSLFAFVLTTIVLLRRYWLG